MRDEKEESFKLRREGKSYKEISTLLSIPKSTLSGWLHSSSWSKNIKKEIQKIAKEKNKVRMHNLNKIRGEKLSVLYDTAIIEAKTELNNLKHYPLFIAGLMIYWGEGEKTTKHQVRISNIDYSMIKIFYYFLIDVCGIQKEKIKLSLLLYPDLNEEECKKVWIKKTGIEKEHFNASTIIRGKHKTKKIRHGVCIIQTSNSYLKKKIMIWIELFPNVLLEEYCLIQKTRIN